MFTWRFLIKLVYKTFFLFVIVNLVFSFGNFLPTLGNISGYNKIFPGRLRFPFGENPTIAYNLSLYNLEAMFASHELDGVKNDDSGYRIIVLGDSSIWGTLLKPEETLSGQLNQLNLINCKGQKVRFFNLGYPTLSLTKDIMILDEAMKYSPDLIVWPVTLESFVQKNQLESPIVANNLSRIEKIQKEFNLNYRVLDSFKRLPMIDRSLIGRRREIADIFRLQFYGVMWAATGIDQEYPVNYPQAARDLEPDQNYYGWELPNIPPEGLSFDILETGYKIAGGTPILLINEPILVSNGLNSNIRYNFYYPHWAYDQFRMMLSTFAHDETLNYLDLWNFIPENEFTNSAIHLNPTGTSQVAHRLKGPIENLLCH